MALERYRVPMYVDAECLGVDESDVGTAAAMGLIRLRRGDPR